MARQEYKVQTNNFTGGFITEASPLSFPENSCLDILNMDIHTDGSVERRKGLVADSTAAVNSAWQTTAYGVVVSSYVWRNAGGIQNKNFVVVQDGDVLRFFNEQDSLGDGAITAISFSLNAQAPVGSTTNVETTTVSMADVNGVLVVASSGINPFYIEYTGSTNPANMFVVVPIDIRVRDLTGIVEDIAVNHRPLNLTDDHYYNLLNQGWQIDKIQQFNIDTNKWPSNADIWSAGRAADNTYSTTELLRIDFGTTPAPKGRFILNPFNTQDSYILEMRTGLPINITDISTPIVTWPNPVDQLDITTATAHGLSAGEALVIEGNIMQSDGENISIDGVHYVDTVISSTEIRIVNSTPWASMPITEVEWGVMYVQVVQLEDTGYVTTARPSTVAAYAGRAWYAGTAHEALADKIMFSQIVSDSSLLGACHSRADPTSEIDSDLVATDGGVITINGLGSVLDMQVQQGSLVVFSTTGVWEIRGEGDSFFSGVGYQVRKITSVPCISSKGTVLVEGTLMFMGEDGIYVLRNNEVSFLLEAINITYEKIKTYYIEHVASCRCRARAVYDYKNRKVMWLHGIPELLPTGEITSPGGGIQEKRLVLSRALILNIDNQAFSKYQFPFGWGEPAGEDSETTVRIMDAVTIRNISSGSPAIRFIYRYIDWSNPQFGSSLIGFASLSRPKREGTTDLNVNEVVSYLYTGHTTLGELGTKKVPRQLILHMLRTEEGFEIDGEELTPIHPSSAKVRVAWDFTTDEDSNKWQQEFQGYRYRQMSVAAGASPTHVGHTVITSKTGLRGNGRAFSMRLTSEPGKDMNILGWSITGSVEGRE